jgi:hypothetical protein
VKKFLNVFEACCAVLALAIVAMFVVYAFPAGGTSIWDVITALGTVAAVIVALGLAVYQGEEQRKEAHTRAVLTATRLLPRIEVAFAGLVPYRNWFIEARYVEPDPRKVLERIAELQQFEFSIDPDLLIALASIDRQCAHDLTLAVGRFEGFQQSLEWTKVPFEDSSYGRDARFSNANMIAEALKHLCEYMEKGMQGCRKASGAFVD